MSKKAIKVHFRILECKLGDQIFSLSLIFHMRTYKHINTQSHIKLSFTLDQSIKFSYDVSDSYLYVSWQGKKIRSEMISEAFVQLLTSKSITTKTCSQARHYAFVEVEKVCHIILLTWIEKNRKKRKRCIFWSCVVNGDLGRGQYVHFWNRA